MGCARVSYIENHELYPLYLPSAMACPRLLVGDGRASVPYEPLQLDPVLKPWRWRVFSELKGAGLRAMAKDGKGGLWLA